MAVDLSQPHVIVGIGEILWDLFPDGPRFGGAPANFACSASGLGKDHVQVHMVSSVGTDDFGVKALEALSSRGVDPSYVATQDKPTGQVLVELDDQGRASYRFADDTAWDNLGWSDNLAELALRTEVCCFGSLGQRSQLSQETIQRFVRETSPTAQRIFDVNLRSPFYSDSVLRESLALANVLKLNDEELPVIAKLCGMDGSDQQVMQQLAKRYDYDLVALTRGPNGALLLQRNQFDEHAGVPAEVVDTVGAGDAFTAALAVGLLQERSLSDINAAACSTAAFVCSQSGATPALPSFNECL